MDARLALEIAVAAPEFMARELDPWKETRSPPRAAMFAPE
jgi:hypothetical protein